MGKTIRKLVWLFFIKEGRVSKEHYTDDWSPPFSVFSRGSKGGRGHDVNLFFHQLLQNVILLLFARFFSCTVKQDTFTAIKVNEFNI